MAAQLEVIIVGAGLGGLGAATAVLLAGHKVLVLESAKELGEIGAGIQILPNASRILRHWGMEETCAKHASCPKKCNMIRWKGEHLSSLDFIESSKRYGSPFWDFHRADLHSALLQRALELGADVRTNSRVDQVEHQSDTRRATVVLTDGRRFTADLVVGADGIVSRTRECFLGHSDPPTPTGDLAYRVLLDLNEIELEEDVQKLIEPKEVNYWMGPGCHAVCYLLRGGRYLNMVLLVPDDIPDGGARTVEGSVTEMRDLFKDWDPRIGKILAHCDSVQKWKLCIRHELPKWNHPSGTFTLLGDAVHATLPYLASGAGMSLEDGAVLGECLSRIKSKSDLQLALDVYEACRKKRTSRIVERGNLQQYLYHLPDGPEQEERDRIIRMNPTPPGDPLVWRDPELSPWLLGYDHIKDVDMRWPKASVSERSNIANAE
ncbi:hypothetical protein DTO271G3_3506 [Paecilomyces variotii]|nr:hypothetical protein DTO271G3_3506 [Paecilomyces variotii]